ncbi:MAG TPA: FAD-binding oxidoreductase [Baekduia sp.]|nr:FAD-binding oxidoreductase [Baekduia sp.]
MFDQRHLALADLLAGSVVLPGDPGWDAARTGFNLALDQHPDAVVLPETVADVQQTVRYARSRGLRVAPQATGHNPGPLGDMRGLLLVSAERFKEVRIDAAALRVRVGSGVRWEEVVPQLSELGLAALHGSSPDVGIAGYSLGGGMGWLARKHGLQTNAVTAIELVTADGRFVRADAEHEADLFWALRGGNGNFGFVTAIEFRVVALEELYAGHLFFPEERAAEVLKAWVRWLPSLPEELMTWADVLRFPDVEDVPEPLRGQSFAIVLAAYQGDETAGRALLEPMRALGPVMDDFAMVPPAGIAELAMDPREPLPYRTAHQQLDTLPDAAIDEVLAHTGEVTMVHLRHMGGAMSRAVPGAGARATLPGEICFFLLAVVEDEVADARLRGALAAAERAVLPYRAGDYPNFVEEPTDASRFFDEETWARLRAVKAAVDPADLFRGNHHIAPAQA